MKSADTYLFFDGNCREAMEFYKKCFDAELFLMPYGEVPGGPPKQGGDRIVHAMLKKNSTIAMASDVQPGTPLQQGGNFSICIECESLAEQKALFQSLGEGGKVTGPLQDTFWGAHFGSLTDRFGINWMFNFMLPKKG